MSVLCASNASNRLAHASSDDILVGNDLHILCLITSKILSNNLKESAASGDV